MDAHKSNALKIAIGIILIIVQIYSWQPIPMSYEGFGFGLWQVGLLVLGIYWVITGVLKTRKQKS